MAAERAPSRAVTRNIFLRDSNADLMRSISESPATKPVAAGLADRFTVAAGGDSGEVAIGVSVGSIDRAGVAKAPTDALIAFEPAFAGDETPSAGLGAAPPVGGSGFAGARAFPVRRDSSSAVRRSRS